MDVTSEVIEVAIQEVRTKRYSDDAIRRQQDLRKMLLSKKKTCDNNHLSHARDQRPSLNSSQMKTIVEEQYQNPEAMSASMCVIDSMLYTDSKVRSAFYNEDVKNYIKDLRAISDIRDTMSNEMYSSQFREVRDMFLIKANQTDDGDHELNIGLNCTNALRDFCPNFTYIYGGFKCGPPIVDDISGRVVKWCDANSAKKTTYILYENVNPRLETLTTYIRSCSASEWMQVYMQVVYALRYANNKFAFTHYNLTTDSVWLRRFTDDFMSIPYTTERGIVEYMRIPVIASITDYSYARFSARMGNEIINVGNTNYLPYFVNAGKPWFYHDVYKLLMYSAYAATSFNNDDVFGVCKILFKFFNKTEELTPELIERQRKHLFTLPRLTSNSNIDKDDYPRYIRSNLNLIFMTPNPTYTVVNCNEGCLTFDKLFAEMGINMEDKVISIPTNIEDYYFMMTQYRDQNNVEAFTTMRNGFDYTTYATEELASLNTKIDVIKSLPHPISIVNMDANQLMTINSLSTVRSMYYNTTDLIDQRRDFLFRTKMLADISEIYNDNNLKVAVDRLNERWRLEVEPMIMNDIETMRLNSQYLDRIQNKVDVGQLRSKVPQLNWYWNGRKSFTFT